MIVLFMILMLTASAYDIKTLHIPIWIVVMQGIVAVIQLILRLSAENGISHEATEILIIEGCLLTGMAVMTTVKRDMVGLGDWIVLIWAVMMLSMSELYKTVMAALILAAVCSAYLMIFKKVKRDHRIPFIPFLTMGMLLGLCTG